jgi:hypothetical protein
MLIDTECRQNNSFKDYGRLGKHSMTHPLSTALGDMIRAELDLQRIKEMFRGYGRDDMRRFWDGIGEDSFYTGPEGYFDCEDIHLYMNLCGDGSYCAV